MIDTSVLVGSAAPEIDEPWVISAVTLGELQAGVLMAADASIRAGRLSRLTAIAAGAPVIPIDDAVAAGYGRLRAATRRQPANDLWIAATALAHDLTLLTADRDLAGMPLIRARLVA